MAAQTADYFQKASPTFSTTIGASGVADGTTTTIPLVSVSTLPTDTGIDLVINRVDGTGALTNNYETVTGTISGSNLISATRGVEGTAQGWAAGTVVEMLNTANTRNRATTGILVEHNQDGTHANVTATSVSVSGNIDVNDASTAIRDSSDNELIKFVKTSSAVNEWTVTNQATGQGPIFAPTGGDSTIAGNFTGKSAFNKHYGLYDIGTAGTTETVNWRNGDRQLMTLDENITITFSNAAAGQTLTLLMLQDGSGTNTITFSDTITWADDTTPSWTTTASKMNIAVITYTGSAYFGVGNKFA